VNPFQKKTALRIALVSFVLASLASPIAWMVTLEAAEEGVVALASEESDRLLHRFDAIDLSGQQAQQHAKEAAYAIAGGLFDIAEIYDAKGHKLAESLTAEGKAVEPLLPTHMAPRYDTASYESLKPTPDKWLLRVFIPLRNSATDPKAAITGYFEGVRVIPAWQQAQIFSNSLTMALMVGLASLLCGVALFPVVVRLAADNQKKSEEILASQDALIEGLRQSEMALEGKVALRTRELETEQIRTRDLLHNMLPREIAQQLAINGTARPVRHEAVTILFTDFSDFTLAAATMPPDRMVAELNDIFAHFDQITDQCGVEKIKTIGDSYMAAAGVPSVCPDHAQRCVKTGLRMLDYVAQRNQTAAFKWSLRVGVHTGPVVAGVVGTKKFAFDIWGDTVNIASRMESSGEVGRVNISAYTYDLVRGQFECSYRGKVNAKGKGQVDMYFVNAEVAT
jgi:class 3 adenylate cyclase